MNIVWFSEDLCLIRMRNDGRGEAKRKPYAWPKERSGTRNDSITTNNFQIGSDSIFINDFLVNSEPYALMISASVVKLCCVYDF